VFSFLPSVMSAWFKLGDHIGNKTRNAMLTALLSLGNQCGLMNEAMQGYLVFTGHINMFHHSDK
jgi:hypothetical protein